LSHFAGNLTSSLTSRRFADVVLHCAPEKPAPDKEKVADNGPQAYPTVRVHRAVLAAISDFLASMLAPFPLEEDVHITLDATPMQVRSEKAASC